MVNAVNSYTMNYSNVAHLPFRDKLRATQLAGYTTMSLMPIDVQRMEQGVLSLRKIRAQADEFGIVINRLDPLVTWSRVWLPDNMDEEYIAKTSTPPEEFFRLCDGLGCTNASLNATYPLNSMTLDEVTEDYVRICKQAAEHGVACDLEFVPLWGLPSLDMAWQVVRDADQPNAALVFDIWHFVRSKPDLELLQTIPGDKINCVQLNDGPLQLPEGLTVKDDCYNRLFPGDGEFPNVEVVRVLAKTNGLNQVGAEIFSPILNDMSVEEVAEKTRSSTEKVLKQAGIAL